MAKELIAFYKKGDQEGLGRKDGHLINYIHAENATTKAGIMDHKAFACVKHDETFLPELQAGVMPLGFAENGIDIPDEKLFSRAALKIDYTKLQTKTGDADLIDKLNAKGVSVPVINGTQLTKEDYLDPLAVSPKVIDLNLITNGTYAIAGGAPDYAAFSNFTADFGTPDGNLIAQVEGAFTDSGAANPTENLGSNTLTFTSDTDHLGVATAGHLVTVGYASHYLDCRMGGTGTITVKKTNFKRTAGGSAIGTILIFGRGASTFKVEDVLCNLNGQRGNLIYTLDADIITEAFNIKVWGSSKIANDSGIYLPNLHASSKFQNVFSYDNYYGFWVNNKVAEFINCVAHSNTGADFNNPGSATGTNCAHTSAGAIGFGTEAGTVSSVVNGSFQSLDDTNAAFGIHTTAGILDGTGTTTGLLANNHGIETNSRITSASISANETLAAAGNWPLLNQRNQLVYHSNQLR